MGSRMGICVFLNLKGYMRLFQPQCLLRLAKTSYSVRDYPKPRCEGNNRDSGVVRVPIWGFWGNFWISIIVDAHH